MARFDARLAGSVVAAAATMGSACGHARADCPPRFLPAIHYPYLIGGDPPMLMDAGSFNPSDDSRDDLLFLCGSTVRGTTVDADGWEFQVLGSAATRTGVALLRNLPYNVAEVFGTSSGWQVTLYDLLGGSAGQFTNNVGSPVSLVAAGPLDSSGGEALVLGFSATSDVRVYRQALTVQNPTPQAVVVLPQSPRAAAVAQMDAAPDTHNDLVIAHATGGTVHWGNGAVAFTGSSPFTANLVIPISRVAAGDFTGDGIPDVLALARPATPGTAGALALVPGNAGRTFGAATVLGGIGFKDLAVADFDDDGDADVAVCVGPPGAAEGQVWLYEGGSGGFAAPTAVVSLGSFLPGAMTVYDDNADGAPDLAVVSESNTLFTRLLNSGAPPAPDFTQQPASMERMIGQSASFTVSAAGAGLMYQWRTIGGTLAGATGTTSATLSIATVSAVHDGVYVCDVSAGGCVTASDPAELDVIGGGAADCTGDGMDDALQVVLGLIQDCDQNGTADICEGYGPLPGFALNFVDGAHASVPVHASLNPPSFTVEAWVKPISPGFGRGIVSSTWTPTMPVSGGHGYSLTLNSTGQVLLNIGAPGQFSGYRTLLGGSAPLGSWTHVAGTFDGSTGQARLMVNGIEVDAEVVTGFVANTTNAFLIGAARNTSPSQNPSQFLRGVTDEVRVWSTARSRPQIIRDMHRRIPGDEPGLTACYRFDEGIGSQASSAVSGPPPATFTGSVTWQSSGPCSIPAPDCPADFNGIDGVTVQDLYDFLFTWNQGCIP